MVAAGTAVAIEPAQEPEPERRPPAEPEPEPEAEPNARCVDDAGSEDRANTAVDPWEIGPLPSASNPVGNDIPADAPASEPHHVGGADGFPVAQRSQGSQLAVEPVAFGLFAQFPLPYLVVVGVQPLVGPDLPVEASQPADAGHDGAVRSGQRMVDDDLAAGRPLVGDGEPGSVGQRLVFAHEPSALLVPFAHVQRERPVLMFLVHDRLLFRNPRARCPGRAWWPRRFCVRSTMPRRSSAAPACAVRRTRHGPRCARGGRARRPG